MARPPLPEAFFKRMEQQLPSEWSALQEALKKSPPTSIRWNKAKMGSHTIGQKVTWASLGEYLSERPNFALDPQWHAGVYYVQEPSSMFIEWLWKQLHLPERPLAILDLCAAPGGKSTHLIDLAPEGSMVVANEVIKSRVAMLEENLVKWGYPNIMVTSADPDRWARSGVLFDVVLVDAPCSGEGLVRKDPGSRLEWSIEGVQHCSARQTRILDAAAPLIKPGGYLIYSTCTWAEDENERQLDGLLGKGFLPVDTGEAPDGVETVTTAQGATAYRLYPHRLQGEGFFCAALRRHSGQQQSILRSASGSPFKNIKDQYVIPSLIKQPERFEWVEQKGIVTAVDKNWKPLMEQIAGAVPTRLLGLPLGQWKGKDFIPYPFLAFSTALAAPFPKLELDQPTEALRFLAKQEFDYPADTPTGWHLVTHRGLGLGWVKVLPRRVNNYYPTAWRLRQSV